MRYVGEPISGLRSLRLDSLTAVYHRRSGQTHLVADPVPEILNILAANPCDAALILNRLAIDDDAEARAALSARLDELIETGLIVRV